jgi:hypothetical protein
MLMQVIRLIMTPERNSGGCVNFVLAISLSNRPSLRTVVTHSLFGDSSSQLCSMMMFVGRMWMMGRPVEVIYLFALSTTHRQYVHGCSVHI